MQVSIHDVQEVFVKAINRFDPSPTNLSHQTFWTADIKIRDSEDQVVTLQLFFYSEPKGLVEGSVLVDARPKLDEDEEGDA